MHTESQRTDRSKGKETLKPSWDQIIQEAQENMEKYRVMETDIQLQKYANASSAFD